MLWSKKRTDPPKYLREDELENVSIVTNEMAQDGVETGLTSTGWVAYRTYTDANGNVRNKSEVLVAMSVTEEEAGEGGEPDPESNIVITYQPEDNLDNHWGSSSYVEVGADNVVAYQWQRHNGTTWVNLVEGSPFFFVDSTELQINPVNNNGGRYRVRMEDENGNYVFSDEAMITSLSYQIINQPNAGDGYWGQSFALGVYIPGSTSYQWQKYNVGTLSWDNLTDGAEYSNTQADNMQIELSNGRTGEQYRIIASDGTTTLTSDPITVTTFDYQIVQVGGSSNTVPLNSGHTILVWAPGSTSYLWQHSPADENTWTDMVQDINMTAIDQDYIQFQATAGRDRDYRCIVSDGITTLTSDTIVVRYA